MRRISTSFFPRAAAAAQCVRFNSTMPSSMPTPCTLLTEDELALQTSVREFANNIVKPKVAEMDEAMLMNPDIIKACFDNGLMGIETPSDLGGAGFNFFGSILAIEELARIDPAVSVMVDVQNTLVNNIFFNFGNDFVKKKFLPQLAQKSLGSFCLSEMGSGSDAFALKTKAEKKGDKWVINGSKAWITNAAEADIFMVMANVDPSKGHKGITCFVVDKREHPGVTIGKKENKMGIRASSTCQVHFDNVEIPEENVVGEVGKGYKIAIEALNEGRIGIGAQMVGLAQGSMDTCMPYIFERKQFGKVVGDFQGMQFQYAQVEVELHAARLMVYNAARKKLAGEDFVADAAMAKLYSSQVAERTSSRAIEWMGGIGFMKSAGVEKYYRDSKIGQIYEGTTNIQLQTIAKSMRTRYAN